MTAHRAAGPSTVARRGAYALHLHTHGLRPTTVAAGRVARATAQTAAARWEAAARLVAVVAIWAAARSRAAARLVAVAAIWAAARLRAAARLVAGAPMIQEPHAIGCLTRAHAAEGVERS